MFYSGDLCGGGGGEQARAAPVHGSDVHAAGVGLLRPGGLRGGGQAVRRQGRARLLETDDSIVTVKQE